MILSIDERTGIKDPRQKNMSVRELVSAYNDDEFDLKYAGQRNSGRWSTEVQSDLIGTALSHDAIPPIIVVVKDGRNLVLDGLQRITTIVSFVQDGFKLSKNMDISHVSVNKVVRDENGKIVRGDDGKTQYEVEETDLPGKYFSGLPTSLQKIIEGWQVRFEFYDLPDDEDEARELISYHLRRYNYGRAMNVSERLMTYLNPVLAESIKATIDMNDLFFDRSGFSKSAINGSSTARSILETLVICYVPESWNKNVRSMARDLNETAVDFKPYINEINDVLDRFADEENGLSDEAMKMLTPRDMFLWMRTYKEYVDNYRADGDVQTFSDFMETFLTSYTDKDFDGATWEELNEKSTKDKGPVMAKIDLLKSALDLYMNGDDDGDDGVDDPDDSDDSSTNDDFAVTDDITEVDDSIIDGTDYINRFDGTQTGSRILLGNLSPDVNVYGQCICAVRGYDKVDKTADEIMRHFSVKAYGENALEVISRLKSIDSIYENGDTETKATIDSYLSHIWDLVKDVNVK